MATGNGYARGWDSLVEASLDQLRDVTSYSTPGLSDSSSLSSIPLSLRNWSELKDSIVAPTARTEPTITEALRIEDAGRSLLSRQGIDIGKLAAAAEATKKRSAQSQLALPPETTTGEKELAARNVKEEINRIFTSTVELVLTTAQFQSESLSHQFMASTEQATSNWSKTDFLQSLHCLPEPEPASEPASSVPPVTLHSKLVLYSPALSDLLDALHASYPLKGVNALHNAFTAKISPFKPVSENESALMKTWNLIQCVAEEASTRSVQSSQTSTLPACRKFLEDSHKEYMQSIAPIKGGDTDNLALVHAFLRVQLKSFGRLDIDHLADYSLERTLDTTWHQVYYCMRSGFYREAIAVAKTSTQRSRIHAMLEEWRQANGNTPLEASTSASQLCHSIVSRCPLPPSDGNRHLAIIAAIISGSRDCAALLTHHTASFFTSIDDFLWFRLAAIPASQPDPGSAATAAFQGSMAACSTLADLQTHLSRFPDSYYSKEGSNPWLYVYIMILSVNPAKALSYLVSSLHMPLWDSSARQAEVVIIALLLVAVFALDSEATADSLGELNAILRQWGLYFVEQKQIHVALSYYLSTAACSGRHGPPLKLQMATALLNLLREKNVASDFVLGSLWQDQGGVLRQLFASQEELQKFVLPVGQEMWRDGRLAEACCIFKWVEDALSAFQVLLEQLADVLPCAPGDVASEAADSIVMQAKLILSPSQRMSTIPPNEVLILSLLESLHGCHRKDVRTQRLEALSQETDKIAGCLKAGSDHFIWSPRRRQLRQRAVLSGMLLLKKIKSHFEEGSEHGSTSAGQELMLKIDQEMSSLQSMPL